MAPTPKTLASQLSKRGPHKVLRGDLSLAGQPGVVYTPAEGFSLPAVAFAHGWMTGVDLVRPDPHPPRVLGLVVAAPATQRTPVPSHLGLAADLRTAVDICAGVRLGPGKISVDATRVAYAGHGMGAGAAVIAAAQHGPAAAVAALFPAPTSPSAEKAAATLAGPGLIIAGDEDIDSLNCNARSIAEAWGGQAILRTVDGGSAGGLPEGRRMLGALGLGGSERRTRRRRARS